MNTDLVTILDGNTFVVSDASGDIEASLTDPTGLFSFDTRFLSRWVLTVNGERLNPLSVDDLQYFETRFFLVPGTGTVYVDAKLSVIRRRAVGDGFHEELTILNHDEKPVDLTRPHRCRQRLRRPVRGQGRAQEEGDATPPGSRRAGWCSATQRETFERATAISASAPRADRRARPDLHRPHRARTASGRPTSTSSPAAGALGAHARPKYGRGERRARPNMERSLEGWLEDAPRLECDWTPLKATYRRSLVDLAALRFSPLDRGRAKTLPAAGLPWFMTMFGRDSIFTSLQALPFTPELAATTLRALGDWQGTRIDDFRDEDPGRILHEMRYGEMTAFEERPHSPYYGAADATPLYVVLLDEYERWTGDTQARPRARGRGAGGAQLDRRVRRPARQRLRLVPAPQRGDRPREPVLEGLVGLDLLPRRAAARLPAGDLRAPGLRLRREDARRPPGPADLEGPRARRRARAGGGRPEAPLQPRLLGRGRRVLRARPRHRRQPGRRAHVEQRPPAVERHRRQVEGKGRRAPPDGAEALLRLGRAHAGRGRGALQPDRLPRRHGLAVRQLVHRVGAAALRLQGGGGADRGRDPRRGGSSSTGASRRRSAATSGA